VKKRQDKNPKILIFSPIFFPDIGGPAVQGKYLCELLIEHGYSVHVLKYSLENSDELPISVQSLNWSPEPSTISRLYRWIFGPFLITYHLFRIRPNVVLVNSVFWNGMVLGLVCKIFNIPSVLKFTGDWVFESTRNNKNLEVELTEIYSRNLTSKIMYMVEKILISNFKVIWVISDFRRKNVEQVTNKPLIWLQNNFHDLPKFHQPIRDRFKHPLVYVTTARLVPHKRIDVIIRAISEVNDDSILIIIGEGSELENLKSVSTSLGVSKRVMFLGKITSDLLFQLLSNSSAYISWSSEEGAPNAFIEAMNFGLPIISARVGGIPDMFQSESRAAKLLEPDNPQDLTMFLKNLSKDLNLLQIMSRDALLESNKYTKATNQNNFLNLFSRLIVHSKF
jgi:glycosyltransferase involved in cell wall biosynthesis